MPLEGIRFFDFLRDHQNSITIFFPRTYARSCHLLATGRPYLLSSLVEEDYGAVTMTVGWPADQGGGRSLTPSHKNGLGFHAFLQYYCRIVFSFFGNFLQGNSMRINLFSGVHYVPLERMWTVQLNAEFERIISGYRLRLTRPLIEVAAMKGSWGSWDPASRSIRIATQLIVEHPWDVVLCILKHEIAHQIVTDIFHMPKEGHGETFHAACRMVGVPEAFRGATGDLPHGRPGQLQEADEGAGRYMEKVRKLLALAQSSNEHEAGLAMQKANQLIKKYNLDRIEQHRDSAYVYRIINHRKKKLSLPQKRICSLLSEYFFIEVVLASLYDAATDETHKTIELMGTVENVEIAEYVYYFLLQQLESLWRMYRGKTGAGADMKRSYQLGVLRGFREKLASQVNAAKAAGARKKVRRETDGLMLLKKDTKLQAFVSERFPRLSAGRSSGAALDRTGYDAGMQAGRELTLHRGIVNVGASGAFLPEG